MRQDHLRHCGQIPVVLLVLGLLALGVAACGGAKQTPRAAAARAAAPRARTQEAQEAKAGPPPGFDRDDSPFLDAARPASAAVSQAITTVVNRFYKVAAEDNGAAACSLLLPSLAAATPLDYGGSVGPAYLRGGKTCAEIMTRLFKYAHAQLAGSIVVTGVRATSNLAYVLLHSVTLPYPYVTVEKYRGTWKVTNLIGATLP